MMGSKSISGILAAVLVWLASAAPMAQTLEVVLADEETLVLSGPDLRAMPVATLVTDTPWTRGEQHFRGVSIEALMEHLPGVTSESRVSLEALNDYAVSIDVGRLIRAGGLVAYERNGEPMPVREYGPLWLLFPYGEVSGSERMDLRDLSVWQLVRIRVQS